MHYIIHYIYMQRTLLLLFLATSVFCQALDDQQHRFAQQNVFRTEKYKDLPLSSS